MPRSTTLFDPIRGIHRFEVWAPNAGRLRLVLGPDDVDGTAMTAIDGGWWYVEIANSAVDLDYGFLIDDATEARPDPRSRRQPVGVHGLSRTYDPAAFEWTDQAWSGRQLGGGLIYELHIGTFTPEGTLDSAIERLPHLVDLGVSFVELLPVNGFNGVHNWGYDGVAWFTVHEGYGGPEGYQRFVDACHALGLAVIQDVVYNHLGPSGNYLPEFGPYLHAGHANTWGSSMNLDGADSEPVRRHIIDNALMWLDDYHVDGLRLDAVHALVDHRATHLLEQMSIEVDALSVHLRRPLTLIAESDLNDSRMITPRIGGGVGITGQWSDDFHHVAHVALTGETVGYYGDFGSMASIAKVLTEGFYHNGTWSSFRGRVHGRPVDTDRLETWRFVVYAQDHDQIGNRACGDRLSATLNHQELGLAAVLVLTSPFTPMLFMGEEWGATTPWQFFTSHPEPELAEATAQGRLAEFEKMGWDESVVPNPQDESTFLNSKLNWAEVEELAHADLLGLYQQLAKLRQDRPELTDPRFTTTSVRYDEAARWLILDRSGLLVFMNFADSTAELAPGNEREVLLATGDWDLIDGVYTVPAKSALILAP